MKSSKRVLRSISQLYGPKTKVEKTVLKKRIKTKRKP